MAGHSQFSNRKHRKSKQDSKKARIFTVLSKGITSAAISNNSAKLNEAINAAKKQNMPKANIDKAINKANKIKSSGGNYDDVIYCAKYDKGFIVICASTDNRNRTISEVKAAVTSKGGAMIESSCISRLFKRKGIISTDSSSEKYFDFVCDLDIEDIDFDENHCEIIVECENLKSIYDSISSEFSDIEIEYDLKYIPTDGLIEASSESIEKIRSLIDELEGLEDVISVDTNYDI